MQCLAVCLWLTQIYVSIVCLQCSSEYFLLCLSNRFRIVSWRNFCLLFFFHFMTHDFHHISQLTSLNTLHAEQMRMLVKLYIIMKEVTSGGHNYCWAWIFWWPSPARVTLQKSSLISWKKVLKFLENHSIWENFLCFGPYCKCFCLTIIWLINLNLWKLTEMNVLHFISMHTVSLE